MKRKDKVRRRGGLPGSPPDPSEPLLELASPPAEPGRSSIERADEHKVGSIETVPSTCPEDGVTGFIETDRPDAEESQ